MRQGSNGSMKARARGDGVQGSTEVKGQWRSWVNRGRINRGQGSTKAGVNGGSRGQWGSIGGGGGGGGGEGPSS